MILSLALTLLIERPQNLGNHINLFIRRIQYRVWVNSQMKRVLSAGPAVLVEWRYAALPTRRCAHHSLHCQALYGGFITLAPSIINSVSSPSPLLRGWEDEVDNSKFIITALSFWWPAYILKLFRGPPRVASLEQNAVLSPRTLQGF